MPFSVEIIIHICASGFAAFGKTWFPVFGKSFRKLTLYILYRILSNRVYWVEVSPAPSDESAGDPLAGIIAAWSQTE